MRIFGVGVLLALALGFATGFGCVDQGPVEDPPPDKPVALIPCVATPFGAAVYGCDGGVVPDGSVGDGGVPDGGVPDGGVIPDGGPADGGPGDAGPADGGLDGGPADGGMDASDASLDAADASMDASVDAPQDAGVDGPPPPVCGNGRCEVGEDACNCPADCANPMTPVCDRRGASAVNPQNPAGYCLPRCSGQCQATWWRWSFWVTQYDVHAWNLDIGEHQGIAIFGDQYRYDERFAWNAPGAAMPPWRHANQSLWRSGDQVTPARQFAMRTSNPSGESAAQVQQHSVPASTSAFCAYNRTFDTPIYNHGRSLARTVPTDREYQRVGQIPLRHLDDSHQCLRRDGTWCYAAATFQPATLDRCFRAIGDGLCESGCGNCSYVAVDAADTAGGLAYSEQILEARRLAPSFVGRELGRRVEYIGGNAPGGVVMPTVINYFRRLIGVGWVVSSTSAGTAPFTHCVDRADEALFFGTVNQNPQQFVLTGGALTGIWGHNSNTDAEAERTMFRQCDTAPGAVLAPGGMAARVCRVCGTDEGQAAPIQFPCRRKTNAARRFWTATSGIHNIDDWGTGLWPGFGGSPYDENNPAWRAAPPRPVPQCNWSGNPVWGM